MSHNVLLQILGGTKSPAHLRRLVNLWPPFLGAGIRIKHIAPDMKAVDVEMKLRFWNANYVGTHFGGSLFAMTDAFYMLMLMANLGRDYIVWDKAASIRYRKPGKGTVRAEFRLTDAQLDDIRDKLKTLPKYEPTFQVEVKDESGEVVAAVEKLLHVRKKQDVAPSEPAKPAQEAKIRVYIPEHFRVHDHADAITFMRANPFAILISTTDEGPFATHLPVFVRETGEHLIIRGHVAKANTHWHHLEQHPPCLTIFHGPHAYVSASNYTTRENVPTWNYGAVHVYGNARIFASPEDLQGVLHELIGTFEPAYADQWGSLSRPLPRAHAKPHRRLRNHGHENRSQIQAEPESHPRRAEQRDQFSGESRGHGGLRRVAPDA